MNASIFSLRIYYEDTDSGGVVYYANYLKYMERARTEWLRSLGFEQDRLIEEEGVIFAVRSVNIDYNAPARFNDQLEVVTSLHKVGRASLSLQQEIRRQGEEQLLCGATVRIASLDAQQFRPKPMPDRLYQTVKKYDK
ncbi:MAG: tol-pal system-associated acyl-CoA thioesterase [Gammaproteobacteria bacterium]|jgi:acyl-CoA thioester hydrolase|nr:tol-pal system-associated acyl-CoA thioesterase [Gammaproteobacteria bacterium]MBT3490345.1 tol-pal system-associated acyl-CoA thioesterase [Gammaproteobacteria bacterium]MBT4788598.1 tol-pal system-associated acyl-CoA thioesterase [Gammaproteobacteria bacterium]MBT5370285.1 tol-pal system-associated acyl-CoA thioesterase [Gammaproteobacteria bacterium]MBT6478637.1 tol-pal system-associated acyl-CoA thioesterase [Gammaproteobacteria bacterium]